MGGRVTSKMFDYLVNGGDRIAELEASLEHMGGYLEMEIEENRKLRAKRLGRPIKEARKGKRYQIGVIVTGDIKAIIAKRAKESGRTISRELEMMIERLLQYEQIVGGGLK
jgi:hypothetical protein